MAGASSASSLEYEDAEDQEREGGDEEGGPLVVVLATSPIHVPGPVVRGQRAIRSSGVIRLSKSDRAHSGPYFRRGGRIIGQTCEFVKALVSEPLLPCTLHGLS